MCVHTHIETRAKADEKLANKLDFGRVLQELPCPPSKFRRHSLELYDTTHAVFKVDCIGIVRLHCHCHCLDTRQSLGLYRCMILRMIDRCNDDLLRMILRKGWFTLREPERLQPKRRDTTETLPILFVDLGLGKAVPWWT